MTWNFLIYTGHLVVLSKVASVFNQVPHREDKLTYLLTYLLTHSMVQGII
jgi:hypothetical protein